MTQLKKIVTYLDEETYRAVVNKSEKEDRTVSSIVKRILQSTLSVRKSNKEQSPSLSNGDDIFKTMKYPDEFEKFWNMYPRRNGVKVEKKKAYELFKKFPGERLDELYRAVKHYSLSEVAIKDNGKWVRNAERFLENNFWEDWIEPPKELSFGDIKKIHLERREIFRREKGNT